MTEFRQPQRAWVKEFRPFVPMQYQVRQASMNLRPEVARCLDRNDFKVYEVVPMIYPEIQ